jgi:hypothetical protein
MTTASEVDEKNPTPYVFVSGDAEQEHQDEINRFASKGYRVIGMSQNSASVSYGKSVVVLMGFGSYAPHYTGGYRISRRNDERNDRARGPG